MVGAMKYPSDNGAVGVGPPAGEQRATLRGGCFDAGRDALERRIADHRAHLGAVVGGVTDDERVRAGSQCVDEVARRCRR